MTVRVEPRPFDDFIDSIHPQGPLRARITSAYRRPEIQCVPPLIAAATLPPSASLAAQQLARSLVVALREKLRSGGKGVDALIQQYSLSSQEGVALMCLAEALLRIPDAETRDALIRDKIAAGDWQSHLGRSRSMFVNAATWGLLITGKLTATTSEAGLSASLTRLIGKGGEPLIRKGVDMTMRLLGEQFVTGQTIEEALGRSRAQQAKGFRYSYDMLGEAAATAADATRYYELYVQAIHAIGEASARSGIYEGPGISIKLSALHPRYARSQLERVQRELLPRLRQLALLAQHYDIGLNIDAEEADRLELSLDLLESLCQEPALQGWNGIGFVAQAYQKRCPFVIDWIIDLARRSSRRIMLRLVKGAYWDGEIKRAQLDGLEDFPVYTRKLYTDVSYLACARRLLAAPDAVFAQFATHNAQTLATIVHMAGANYYAGQYEFQCLHGMGEPLYEEVVGAHKLNRPCRIYAPVGTHETLLAYLVRRLLENGANTSFVNRIADPSIDVDELILDPVTTAAAIVPLGAPHPKISLPRDLFAPIRSNSMGLDFSNEQQLAQLASELALCRSNVQCASPLLAAPAAAISITAHIARTTHPIHSPADQRDLVGHVSDSVALDIETAFAGLDAAAAQWSARPGAARAAILGQAAELLQSRRGEFINLIVREAGRTLNNAVGEVREATDFLRYYAAQVRELPDTDFATGTGPTPAVAAAGAVVCISPWNFPLAIFVGQIAAALAAGRAVLAKPAEQTPLTATLAVQILHSAGVPDSALQLLPGDGSVGASLVADPRTSAVMFTGSTAVARQINAQLARRLGPDGQPVPLIAETGGQNAMIVDSSALSEQVVADVLASAFDSAGQRCSALRVLCVQRDVADRILTMLKGAMQELSVGNPDRLASDVGPVISTEARATLLEHIERMRSKGHSVFQQELAPGLPPGVFVPPTLIEIDAIGQLQQEVFGPVLHVLRYERAQLDHLIEDINATGYGLTFGLHTRIDETIERVCQRINAGNLYVNRNTIGAVVGVQPFGGHGLSGTGPKAGGPLYLSRLQRPAQRAALVARLRTAGPTALDSATLSACAAFEHYARTALPAIPAQAVGQCLQEYALGRYELAGPVGELNEYRLRARGRIGCCADSPLAGVLQFAIVLATGNTAVVEANHPVAVLGDLPATVAARRIVVPTLHEATNMASILYEGSAQQLLQLLGTIARRPGPIIPVQAASAAGLALGTESYGIETLVHETSVSTNTAAAGGNASLMTIG